jgi:hypothetical protein
LFGSLVQLNIQCNCLSFVAENRKFHNWLCEFNCTWARATMLVATWLMRHRSSSETSGAH